MIDAGPSVALVLTVHEPDERLVPLIEAQLPALVAQYTVLAAFCSRETHPAILALLSKHETLIRVNRAESLGIAHIGAVRREALRTGLRTESSHLHMCDFDRAVHWVAHYPRELAQVVADLPAYDLLVLGRTERAWATHPPYQAETEPLFNKVFFLATGLPWDIGAGSRGLSRPAAQRLLEISRERTVGVDAEWPLLLLQPNGDGVWVGHRPGCRAGYRACEGLEFETADRFGPEIAAAGGYAAWQEQMSADPGRWAFRLQVAQLIAAAVARHCRLQSKGYAKT